jgi:transcription initiation factor IIE alpha subunit
MMRPIEQTVFDIVSKLTGRTTAERIARAASTSPQEVLRIVGALAEKDLITIRRLGREWEIRPVVLPRPRRSAPPETAER